MKHTAFEPPEGFSRDAAALFYAVVGEKQEQGTLTAAALPLVVAYVRSVEGYNEISEAIAQEETSLTINAGGEREYISPLFRQQRSYLEQMTKAAAALGITPHHRERWLKQNPEPPRKGQPQDEETPPLSVLADRKKYAAWKEARDRGQKPPES